MIFGEDLEKIGVIGVDAGLCWVGDPCYIIHEKKPLPSTLGQNWEQFCDRLEGDATQFDYTEMHASPGLGVAVSTYCGDGEYPVYAVRGRDGIRAIVVDFDCVVEDEEQDWRIWNRNG